MAENLYKRKVIKVRITLMKNYFPDGSNSIVINDGLQEGDTGLPVEVKYNQTFSYTDGGSEIALTIYNLSYEHLAAISCVHLPSHDDFMAGNESEIEVSVGNIGESLTPIFLGYIQTALADFNNAPSPTLKIKSWAMAYESVIADNPIEYKAGATYDSIFRGLAVKMNHSFVNHGVSGSIPGNVTVKGSPYNKATYIATTYKIGLRFEDSDRKMVIYTPDWTSDDNPITISKENGLIGYPMWSNNGITFRCLYNPMIGADQPIKIDTIVPLVSDETWKPQGATHTLTCFMKGPWESQVQASSLPNV